MKVVDALVCMDCEEVFEKSPHVCPTCGSTSTYPLRNWIELYNPREFQCPAPTQSPNR